MTRQADFICDKTRPLILLNFDVEEFDLPAECGSEIPFDEQCAVSVAGLRRVDAMLERLGARATLFTTVSFAAASLDILRNMAHTHEIASHGVDHGVVKDGGPAESRQMLNSLFQVDVKGFRSPRLQRMESKAIAAAGYSYNSSENPIWLPGRYNNLGRPRTAYIEHGVLNIPASATPLVRFPLFWLSFKNLPTWFLAPLSILTLRHDGYLNVYFHPWEFADISAYAAPFLVKRISGEAMARRLESYLRILSRHGRFAAMEEYDCGFRCGQKVSTCAVEI